MICLKFVWRQLGFAFFGALTSVGALFILLILEGKMETNQREKELETKDFRKESKAERLLAIAEEHNGKYRRSRN